MQALGGVLSAELMEKGEQDFRAFEHSLLVDENAVASRQEEVFGPHIEAVKQMAAALDTQKRKQLPEVVETLALAEIRQSLAADPERVQDLLLQLADAVGFRGNVFISGAPSLKVLIESKGPGFFQGSGSVDELTVAVDPEMEPGGFVVRSSSGVIDARPSMQVKLLVAALLGL
jgi:flagellar biosynthesis/type III secretory pathway protein FliH